MENIDTELLNRNKIFLFGEITDELAHTIIKQLLYIRFKNTSEITLYIDSYGGDVSAAVLITNIMSYIKGLNEIKTVCFGQCESCANLILAFGTKGLRYAHKNSRFMLHKIKNNSNGSSDEIVQLVNENDKTIETYYKIYSNHTGLSIEELMISIKQ